MFWSLFKGQGMHMCMLVTVTGLSRETPPTRPKPNDAKKSYARNASVLRRRPVHLRRDALVPQHVRVSDGT